MQFTQSICPERKNLTVFNSVFDSVEDYLDVHVLHTESTVCGPTIYVPGGWSSYQFIPLTEEDRIYSCFTLIK